MSYNVASFIIIKYIDIRKNALFDFLNYQIILTQPVEVQRRKFNYIFGILKLLIFNIAIYYS